MMRFYEDVSMEFFYFVLLVEEINLNHKTGGLILGPIGLAVGGAVGGSLAAWMAQDKFKPLVQVIMEDMRSDQRERMIECLRKVLSQIEPTDALALVAMVQGNQALKARLATEMVTFLSRQCNIYVNE